MKILAIDIETSPNVAYTWGLFKQNVGLNQIVSTSEIICFAAKWIGDDRGTYPGEQRPRQGGTVFYGGLKHDREEMLNAAHDLLDQADVVMHYNGKSFDIPHLNREFLEARMSPPSPFKQIDLYLVARSRFRFVSNRLDHVTKELGLDGKVQHEGFDLWKRCLAGDETAWRKMERYNRRDVTLLEDLYEILLPWIQGHPNRTLYDGKEGVCPRCGSDHVQRRGSAYTSVSEFWQYQCQTCGGWYRTAKRVRGTTSRDIAA